MSEKHFAHATRQGILGVCPPPLGFVGRLENLVGAGWPDIYYCLSGKCGWLELKILDAFPKRSTTPVRVAHFTNYQRAWLHDYNMAGGTCFVWLKVGQEHFLLDGLEAAMYLGRSDAAWHEEDIRNRAVFTSGREVNWKDFVKCLTSH